MVGAADAAAAGGQATTGRGDDEAVAALRRDHGSRWRIWYQGAKYLARQGDTEPYAAAAAELGAAVLKAEAAWQR